MKVSGRALNDDYSSLLTTQVLKRVKWIEFKHLRYTASLPKAPEFRPYSIIGRQRLGPQDFVWPCQDPDHRKPRPSGHLSPLDSNPCSLSSIRQPFLLLSTSPSLCALTFERFCLFYRIQTRLEVLVYFILLYSLKHRKCSVNMLNEWILMIHFNF